MHFAMFASAYPAAAKGKSSVAFAGWLVRSVRPFNVEEGSGSSVNSSHGRREVQNAEGSEQRPVTYDQFVFLDKDNGRFIFIKSMAVISNMSTSLEKITSFRL